MSVAAEASRADAASHPRIAIVGAGGYQFPFRLIRDLLAFPALQGCELRLLDIRADAAERTARDAAALIEHFELPAHVHAIELLQEALRGCDIVVTALLAGGREAYHDDLFIPLEYGIDQAVGDTLGPGGIFAGLRSVAALREVAAAMHEVCPGALLLQYVNPMSINCWATTSLGIQTVGLCPSVRDTAEMLATELELPYEEIVYDCAGVNHTAWFTTFRHGRLDLIPVIRETMTARHLVDGARGGLTDDIYHGRDEKVRAELMRLTGYFHTESSHHASEYWAWFRRTEDLVREYIPERWSGWEYVTAPGHDAEARSRDILAAAKRGGLAPSEEQGACIIESLIGGTPRVVYGNVPNDGLINNLAGDAIVEVACAIDARGLRPIRYGALPAACSALNEVQINVQRLAAHAALTGDRGALHAAVALDPLTSSVLPLAGIREMVERMLSAEARWLPQFAVA